MSREVFGSARAPLSPALKVGQAIFISGQIPRDESGEIVSGGVSEQTAQVMDNIERLLREAGASMEDVVKTFVVLTDVKRDFTAMNSVYERYFPGVKPSRTTVGAQLAIDALVEIEAIAIVG